jgi:nucleoside-diphosphate-sugar epimerase
VAELCRHGRVRAAEPEDDLADAMAGADVVHLALGLRSPFEHPREAAPHPLLVSIVAHARRAGVRRLVYLSSASVLGFGPDGWASERTPPRPVHPYERALAADEWWMRQQAEPEVVVLRPAQGFGPDEPVSSRLVEQLRSGRLRLPGGGRALRTFLAGADLGRAFHAAAVRGQPGVYLLGGFRGCWLELARVAAARLGIGARLAWRSYDAAYLAAAARLPRTGVSRRCWPTPFLLDLLARPQVLKDGWSRRALSWRPEVDGFAAGLTELAGDGAAPARSPRTLT